MHYCKYVCDPFDLPLTKTQKIVGTRGRQLWLGRYEPIVLLPLPVHLKRQQAKSVKCGSFVAYNPASLLL